MRPQRDEAQAGGAALGSKGQDQPTLESVRQATAERDATITALKVALAIRGFELHIGCEGYVVQRWALHRKLPDLAAVEQFLEQVGGAA